MINKKARDTRDGVLTNVVRVHGQSPLEGTKNWPDGRGARMTTTSDEFDDAAASWIPGRAN